MAAIGQQMPDTTLNEVHVRDTRTPSADIRLSGFSAGQQAQQIDSATLAKYSQQSLATLLTQQLPVFVRSYSFNGLATGSLGSTVSGIVEWHTHQQCRNRRGRPIGTAHIDGWQCNHGIRG
jgi:hypothetical protein